MDPIQMLKEDHQKVKQLKQQFEQAENASEKKKIAQQALQELEIHAALEEEIFYPAVRKKAGDQGKEMMLEAEEEHHVVHVLVDELKEMRSVTDKYEAKFKVLMENVDHHVQEEESEMLPQARVLLAEDAPRLAEQMQKRKEALLAEAK